LFVWFRTPEIQGCCQPVYYAHADRIWIQK
jgi:hypothetical protein